MIAGGLFMAPGLRYGRLIQQALFPPMWSREYVSFTPGIKALLRLGFALPLVAVPLWVSYVDVIADTLLLAVQTNTTDMQQPISALAAASGSVMPVHLPVPHCMMCGCVCTSCVVSVVTPKQ